MKTKSLLIAILLLTASSLFAAGHGGSCLCGHISGTKATWQLEFSTQAYKDAAQAEFDRWNKYANVFTTTAGNGTFGINGQNEIVFATPTQIHNGYGFNANGDLFGVTPSFPEAAFGNPSFDACPVPVGTNCGTFTESDVLINTDFSRGWTTTGPPDFDDNDGPAFFGATAVHELGHSLGFHHNFDNVSTMNYYEDFACQYITAADAFAFRQAYPQQAQSVTDMGTYPFWYDPNGFQYQGMHAAETDKTTVAPGGTISVKNVNIENVGSANLQNVTIRFYLSTDRTITSSDVSLGGGTFNTFDASNYWDDGGQGFPNTLTVPANTPGGSYYFGALITHSGGSTDSITYNNSWTLDQKVTVTGGTGGPTCTSALLLNNSRFQITAKWKDFQNNTGCGTAVPISADTGYFWFFNSANVELVIKALDGRGVNNHFWIFYGALSNVEYDITVKDTVTGATKTYHNNSGSFGSVGDTAAF